MDDSRPDTDETPEKKSVLRAVGRGAKDAARSAASFAARGAGHIAEGEMRRRLGPARARLTARTEALQSRASRRIDHLASRIRRLGHRIERAEEAHVLARRLEETADYLRYRPSGLVARDAISVAKEKRIFLLAGVALGAFLTYKLIKRKRG
ncbi:MAG TPA: hypothetical protein VKZ59_16860 [Acidobacteriota bacterium]|nr:hypothetical protein [Acidobacteriota bacterium]